MAEPYTTMVATLCCQMFGWRATKRQCMAELCIPLAAIFMRQTWQSFRIVRSHVWHYTLGMQFQFTTTYSMAWHSGCAWFRHTCIVSLWRCVFFFYAIRKTAFLQYSTTVVLRDCRPHVINVVYGFLFCRESLTLCLYVCDTVAAQDGGGLYLASTTTYASYSRRVSLP